MTSIVCLSLHFRFQGVAHEFRGSRTGSSSTAASTANDAGEGESSHGEREQCSRRSCREYGL